MTPTRPTSGEVGGVRWTAEIIDTVIDGALVRVTTDNGAVTDVHKVLVRCAPALIAALTAAASVTSGEVDALARELGELAVGLGAYFADTTEDEVRLLIGRYEVALIRRAADALTAATSAPVERVVVGYRVRLPWRDGLAAAADGSSAWWPSDHKRSATLFADRRSAANRADWWRHNNEPCATIVRVTRKRGAR